ncbi:hypothetical protein GW17_00015947 [Ensete ventricosum]|nr:hypothetical protein GW17_00015947 [Ensete ventricosum]RZS12642.1 hypothetical protein BHM03_00044132 [Ensete ventricosum]
MHCAYCSVPDTTPYRDKLGTLVWTGMLNLARKDNPAVSALDVISSTFAGSFSSSSVHEDALSAPNQVFARQPGPGVGHTA